MIDRELVGMICLALICLWVLGLVAWGVVDSITSRDWYGLIPFLAIALVAGAVWGLS